jgi:hypothetical protein
MIHLFKPFVLAQKISHDTVDTQDTDTSATTKYKMWMGPTRLQDYTEQAVAYLMPYEYVHVTSCCA